MAEKREDGGAPAVKAEEYVTPKGARKELSYRNGGISFEYEA